MPYVAFYSILLSSVFSIPGEGSLALYHLVSATLSLIFLKQIYTFLLRNKYFLFFVAYISLSFIFEVLYVNLDSAPKVLIRFFNSLVSFSMLLLVANYFITRKDELDSFIRHFVVIVTLFGLYQLIARILDLPFGVLEYNRFRDYGGMSQATSFFREPRYYGIFIGVFLYIVLFYYQSRYKACLIFLLVLSGLLTQSVTAFVLLVSILLLFFFRKVSFVSIAKGMLFTSVFLVVSLQFESVVSRIDLLLNSDYSKAFEFLLHENIGQGANKSNSFYGEICAVGAGCATSFGEAGYLLQVLEQSPLFGYGAAYSFGDMYRTMALNGIVEIVLRWGLVGLLMFFVFILRKRKNKGRLLVVVLVYLISFGNVGQSLFWLLLSLIYTVHSLDLYQAQVLKK